jgi:geranylgeranylglycerol-phosphate geranylgeranyltransferase
MGVVGVMTGALIASGLDIADHWKIILIASAVVVLFIAGGNALNDYIDRDIDRTSHPERPIPSGRMSPKEALTAGIAAFTASIVISLIAVTLSFVDWDLASLVIVLVACALMLSYELFLKQRGFIGNVTIAVLTGMLFLLGGAVVGNIEAVIPVTCMAVLVSIGREIAKDIEDMKGDEGRSTLPMRIGVRRACAVASVMLIAGTALIVWPIILKMFGPLYYLIFAAGAVFIYASYIIHKDARKAQQLCKYAMLVALAAFILGAVYT